jgi:hypothetical protein
VSEHNPTDRDLTVSVSKVGGFFARPTDRCSRSRNSPRRGTPLADPNLTPEQQAEAQRLYQLRKQATDDDLLRMARLLASKPDHPLLGATEFALRDHGLQIGAKAVAPALDQRKKAATQGRA